MWKLVLWVLLGFNEFDWVSMGLTGFYNSVYNRTLLILHWVSMGFTGFYLVLQLGLLRILHLLAKLSSDPPTAPRGILQPCQRAHMGFHNAQTHRYLPAKCCPPRPLCTQNSVHNAKTLYSTPQAGRANADTLLNS